MKLIRTTALLALAGLPLLAGAATTFDETARQRFLDALRVAADEPNLHRAQSNAVVAVNPKPNQRSRYPAINHCTSPQGEQHLLSAARTQVAMILALTEPRHAQIARARQEFAQFSRLCPADVANGKQFMQDIAETLHPIQQQKIARQKEAAELQRSRGASSGAAGTSPALVAGNGQGRGGIVQAAPGHGIPSNNPSVPQTVRNGVWYRCSAGDLDIFRHFVYRGPRGGRVYEQWARYTKDHGYQAHAMYVGDFEVTRDGLRILNATSMKPDRTWIDARNNQYAVQWSNEWRIASRDNETLTPRDRNTTPNRRDGFVATTPDNRIALYCEDTDNDQALVSFLSSEEKRWGDAVTRAVYEAEHAPKAVAAARADASAARSEIALAIVAAEKAGRPQCQSVLRLSYDDVARGDQMSDHTLRHGTPVENGARGSVREWRSVAGIYRLRVGMLQNMGCG